MCNDLLVCKIYYVNNSHLFCQSPLLVAHVIRNSCTITSSQRTQLIKILKTLQMQVTVYILVKYAKIDARRQKTVAAQKQNGNRQNGVNKSPGALVSV